MALSKTQIDEYYASQGSSATPQTPAQYEQSLQPKPDIGGVITSDSLKPETPLVVPTPTTTPEPSKLDLSSFIKEAQGLYAPDPEEIKARDTAQGIVSAYLGAGGKAETRVQTEADLGVQAKRNRAQASARKMQLLHAESDTLEERLQKSVEGRGVTEGGLRPIASAQQRDLAVRQRFAAAEFLADQGDLTSALSQVETAVNDKFADKEANIKNAQAQLDFLQKKIDEGTVRRTKEIDVALAERTRLLNKQAEDIKNEKADQTTIFGWGLVAKHNGASDYVVSQIQNAKDLKSAMALYAPYSVDPNETAKAVAELEQTRAQTRLLNANTSKAYAEERKAIAEATAAGTLPLDGQTPFVADPNYKRLTPKQKTQADSLNNLVREIKKYRKQVDDSATFAGTALLGQNAALIKAQQAAIIFAAAQAEGTGALQKADRDVIDQMIPNPATFVGAGTALLEGGKKGQLAKIDDQITKYTNNLKGYGLKPAELNQTNAPQGQTGTLDDGTVVTKTADGRITDADGNEYDENGNKIK